MYPGGFWRDILTFPPSDLPLSTPAAFNSSSPNSPPLHLGASQPPCLVFKWRRLGWTNGVCERGRAVPTVSECVSQRTPFSLLLWRWWGRAAIVTHTAPDATKALTAVFVCTLNVRGLCIVFKAMHICVYCVCFSVLARARVELMCFCMFFLFISSRFIRQMGTTCPFPLLPLLLCEGVYFHAISQQALLSLTHIDSFSLKHKWFKPESLSPFHQLLKMTLTCWYWATADI